MTTKQKRKRKPEKKFEELVDFTPIPDGLSGSVRRSHGKRTGLGVRQYIWNLLYLNEQLPASKKMTNAMIEYNVRKEFADRDKLLKSIDKGRQSVSWWRHLYNRGKLFVSRGKPNLVSFRYNSKGEMVDSRTGVRPLTTEEARKICADLGIKDKRFFPEEEQA